MATIRKRKFGPNKEREAYVVAYTDQHGKRRIKTFATKKEAEAWKVDALHEVKQGTHTPASTSKTVEEVWGLWLEDCEANNLEFGTIRQRRLHLKIQVAPYIGRLRLSNLTAPLVYDFDSKLRQDGHSLAMRRKVLTNLKTMLTFAQGRGLVAQNVARGGRIKTDSREATAGPLRIGVDLPTMAELNTLIENATGRWRPFVITAIFTGMRLSELRGLRWSDVDLEAGVIHVRQRADAWRKIGPTKSKAGMRDIPLTPMALNALKQWRLGCPKGDLDLVFPNTLGNVEMMANIHSRCWGLLQIKCGLTDEAGKPRYTFHALRHVAASLFIRYLGWSPKRLQTVMGHASVTMTFDRYGHLFENVESDRADMAKIEAAIRVA
jgi:integrase